MWAPSKDLLWTRIAELVDHFGITSCLLFSVAMKQDECGPDPSWAPLQHFRGYLATPTIDEGRAVREREGKKVRGARSQVSCIVFCLLVELG